MNIHKKYIWALSWALMGLVILWWAPKRSVATVSFVACLATILCLIRLIGTFGLVSAPAVYATLFAFFHFGTVVSVYTFGLPTPLIQAGLLDANLLSQAVVLATIGLLALTAGCECGRGQFPRKSSTTIGSHPYRPADKAIFRLALVLMLTLTALYLLLALQSGLLTGGKAALVAARREGSSQFALVGIISEVLLIVSFIAVAYAPRRYLLLVAIIPVLPYVQLFLSGKRGSFILLLASLALVVKKRGLRIPMPVAVAAIPAGMLAASLIRQSAKSAADFGSAWYLNALYEMGQQIYVVILTIKALQTHITEYWYGTSYLWGIWRVIPNAAGLRALFPAADPGIWITAQYGGDSGLGFSSVAEAFLNFGWLGAFLIMGLIGVFLSRFEYKGSFSPKALAIYGATLGGLLFAIRGDMSGVFRSFFWAVAFVLVLEQVASIVRRRNAKERPLRASHDKP